MKRAAPAAAAIPPWMRLGSDHLSIEVAARPGASRSEIKGIDERGLLIAIAAAPERGKANDELIRLIVKIAEVPRSAVSIIKGDTARRKTLRIKTPAPAECATKLIEAASRTK
jgi:uncharacterized protein